MWSSFSRSVVWISWSHPAIQTRNHPPKRASHFHKTALCVQRALLWKCEALFCGWFLVWIFHLIRIKKSAKRKRACSQGMHRALLWKCEALFCGWVLVWICCSRSRALVLSLSLSMSYTARPYESCKSIQGPALSICPFGAGPSLVQNISTWPFW